MIAADSTRGFASPATQGESKGKIAYNKVPPHGGKNTGERSLS